VPLATSGRVRSEDEVVSVKAAVNVRRLPFCCCPRAYSSSNRSGGEPAAATPGIGAAAASPSSSTAIATR
jgi:hypothetical protein